ncbi:MAG: aminotransferase class V-fold PLP-dependent enzyme [Oscillospiraceae bacterium]|nr:aminotransferase class V-fold PLP-dependent enzyme [Oscillospiraceae bacterium]
MIYFDNAATTYPKPPAVRAAVKAALHEYGGNPGRSGHKTAMKSAEAVFNARAKIADFFSAQVENVIFTLNCTHALNMAIKGIAAVSPSTHTHYIISDLEHNAVARPVHAMSQLTNISNSIAKTYDDDAKTLAAFEAAITPKTRAIICTAASNVTGAILPFREIAALCKARGICFILDASQGAGLLSMKIGDGVNFICCSGHKGLYGPMGTGLLISDGTYALSTIIEGGTGGNSLGLEQPAELPDRFESGTGNTPGIIALGAGVDFVCKTGAERILAHELKLCEYFRAGLAKIPQVKVYSANMQGRLPLVPFNAELAELEGGMDSTMVSSKLSEAGFALRGGLHCAYLAHKKLKTLESGVVRFAPSAFNSQKEVEQLLRAIRRIVS